MHGAQDAAGLVHLGLYSLQHRGQESAGIVAVDADGVARAKRRMGLVSEGLNVLDELAGTLAIGHTRYSTAGSSSIDNAQPVLVRFRGGYIALAHNGNIVNASELRGSRAKRGACAFATP
ncbi:MAG TPA: amidophosphoribosyltransferase, partial [Casimicrobiaceae bacterium]|nr:amidophosphoribosyltransferase [Casimicrobiaceae bacterium]